MREFKFDIDTGIGSFLPPKGKPIDVSAIQTAVKESGFELLWLEAQVRGVLQGGTDPTGGTRPSLRVEETGQLFLLVEGRTDEERQNHDRLRQWVNGPDRHVVVHGRLHAHVGNPPGLTVRRFRLVQEGQDEKRDKKAASGQGKKQERKPAKAANRNAVDHPRVTFHVAGMKKARSGAT